DLHPDQLPALAPRRVDRAHAGSAWCPPVEGARRRTVRRARRRHGHGWGRLAAAAHRVAPGRDRARPGRAGPGPSGSDLVRFPADQPAVALARRSRITVTLISPG